MFERLALRAEAESTSSLSVTRAITALGLVMLLADPVEIAKQRPRPTLELHQGSQSSGQAIELSDRVDGNEFVAAFLSFHDAVLATQEDLPAPAREVLYSNLWQLYE
jgi:hypothetical protein